MEASNNEEIEFSIGIDGVEEEYFATVVGNGTRDQSAVVRAFNRTAGVSAVYTLMARAVDGAASITVSSAQLIAVIQPTNNP